MKSDFVGLRGASFYLFTLHSYLLLRLCLLLIHRKRSPFSRRRRLLLRLKSFRASHSAFNSFRICGFAATSLRVKRATSFARMGKHHCQRHIICECNEQHHLPKATSFRQEAKHHCGKAATSLCALAQNITCRMAIITARSAS